MKRLGKDYHLSLVLLSLFVGSWAIQTWVGRGHYAKLAELERGGGNHRRGAA